MRILDKKRKNYKKRFFEKGKCVFCGRRDVLECKKLAGKNWKVLVNQFPYMDGNVMIVSKRHISRTEDINEQEWQEFGLVLEKTQKALRKIFKINSFNVGLNIGPESGASIPHIHWQIVPRKFKNITTMNTFADLYVVGVTPEETKRLIDGIAMK